ncbi:MAG TPA: potassium transporter TrkG [Nitrososphaera sp.]
MENALDRPVTSFVNRQFVLIDGETDVAKAVETMQARNGDTIIVTRRGAPIGIVTDSDILDKVVQTGGDSDRILLKTIMTSPVITASPKATAREVLGLMRFYKIKRIPIVEDEKVVGIVTQRVLADSIRTSVLERTFRKYRSAVRDQLKTLLGNMGMVIQFAGILLVFPALLGAFTGQTESAAGMFIAVVGLFATGFVLNTYGERGPLNLKQSSILVVSSFLLLGLFGSIPYMYVNPFGNVPIDALFVNSFFESISGFTTTGLSMIAFPENMPDSLIFYRAYTQWTGGLSFIYLIMTLFYPEQKLQAMRGFISGSTLRFKQLLITISIIFTIYTVVLALLFYSTGGTNPYHTLALVFDSVTGGGFSPSSTAVTPTNVPHLLLLGVGMIISALPFAFHYSIFFKELRRKKLGIEVLVYGMVMISAVPVFLVLSGTDPLTSAFHVVSASTNSGFQYLDVQASPTAAKAALIVLMMAGGTTFSTAGGIKIGRFLLIYQKLAKKDLTDVYTSVSPQSMDKASKLAAIVIGLFIGVALVTGAALSVLESVPFEDALFEAVSALTTTGLSTGIIAVDADLVPKLILMINMVAGRFEIVAILFIFVAWFRR